MKHENRGETAGTVKGTVNNPKSTANHPNIPNTISNAKEVSNQGMKGSVLPPPKK